MTQQQAFSEFGKLALMFLNEGAIQNTELEKFARDLKLPLQSKFNLKKIIGDKRNEKDTIYQLSC